MRPVLNLVEERRSVRFLIHHRTTMTADERLQRRAIDLVSLADIQEAAERIAPHVIRTPLLTNAAIDDVVSQALSPPNAPRLKIRLAFKAEHLQVVG